MNRKTLLDNVLWAIIGLAIALIVINVMGAQAQVYDWYTPLDLRAICRGRFEIVNVTSWSGEVYWQIWSSFEWVERDRQPYILYEGSVYVDAGSPGNPSHTRFRAPAGYTVMIYTGPMWYDDQAGPSNKRCTDPPPPYSWYDLFKYTTETWPDGTPFEVYNVGDVFLDVYAPSDLGYQIPASPVTNGEVYLTLNSHTWPASQNFVGFLGGVKVIEFRTLENWPDAEVVWVSELLTEKTGWRMR